jgi:hypothetical protein
MLSIASDQMARLLVAVYGVEDEAALLDTLEKDYPTPVARDALRNALDWRRNSDLFD